MPTQIGTTLMGQPLYDAPGSTGDWSYNNQLFGWQSGAIDPGIEGGVGPPVRNMYYGNQDDILNSILQTGGVTRSQWDQQLAGLGQTDPYAYLGQAISGQEMASVNGANARNNITPYLAMLQSAGYDWRNDPQLSSAYTQGQQSAQQEAEQINQVNSQGTSVGDLLKAAAMVWGGGFLGGTALGAAQGLGSFGSLLANPSLTGVNLGGATAGGLGGAAGAIPWNQAFAGSDLGGSLVPLGAEGAGGGGLGWAEQLAQYPGLESLGGLNASELAGLGITPESLGLGATTITGGLSSATGGSGLGSAFGLPASSVSGTGLWNKLLNGIGGLTSGSGSGGWGVNPSGSATGGLLGGLLGGSNLSSALGLAPILGGLAYAYGQTGFDTSQLNDLYNQYNPNAMASQYDVNTNLGRDSLTSGLARRGLTGSSFATNDITNYNTARDLGRANLISSSVPAAAGIANNILGANIKEQELKNQLIGTGLYSIGTLFGGK